MRHVYLFLRRMATFFFSFFNEKEKIVRKAIKSDDCDEDLEEIIHREKKKYSEDELKERLKYTHGVWKCWD